MQKEATSRDESVVLGSGKLGRLLWHFALPCVLSLLVSSLYNICDQIYIGHAPELGYLGNAATSIVFPITVVAMAFAWCFGDGTAAYLSLCQGKCDTKRVHRAVGNSLLATLVSGVVIMLLGYLFTEPVLRLFGASDVSLPLAREYFVIILGGLLVFMLGNTLNPIIRADGSPRMAMAATLAGAITNIILDPIFIYQWGLGWGIAGAAWATVIGQIVTLVVSLVYLLRSQVFRLTASSFRPDWGSLRELTGLGVSTFITQMAIVVVSLVCNLALAKYGAASPYGADIPIAAIGIVMKVFTIVISIAIGITLGAQPILGYNYGAQKYDRVKQLYRLVIACVLVVGVAGTLLFEFAPGLIVALFGSESALYQEFALKTVRIFLSGVGLTCLIRATAITFQALGKPVQSTIISLGRDIACFIPLTLILPRFYGLEGILWAAPVADILGFILTLALAAPFFRQLGRPVADETHA